MDYVEFVAVTIHLWRMDVNGNGTLDYGEFLSITICLRRMDNYEYLENAISFFDTHGDGFIDCDKLKEILWGELDSVGMDMINGIIQEVDADKISSIVWNINNYVFLRIDIFLPPV